MACLPNGFISLATNQQATITGTPTYGHTQFGPCLKNASQASGIQFQWLSNAQGVPSGVGNTIAGIFQPTVLPTGNPDLFDVCNNMSMRVSPSGSTIDFGITYAGSGSSVTGAAPLAVNGTYFLVCSCLNGTGYNAVAVNLLTGKLFTQVVSFASLCNPAGAGNIGLGYAGNQLAQGNIFAMAYIPAYLSMPLLKMWAADPWSFWYQRKQFSGKPVTPVMIFRQTETIPYNITVKVTAHTP
jgi:hypothetical protein